MKIAERTPGVPIAFMGVENGRLEMLFLALDKEGRAYPLLYMKLA